MRNLQKGFALITVLTLSVLIGIGIVAMLQVIANTASVRRMSAQAIKAQYLAEAGAQHAVAELRNGVSANGAITTEDFPIAIQKTSLGDGTYQVDVTVTYPE